MFDDMMYILNYLRQSLMNHYQWLDENLNDFWLKVFNKSLDETGCAGIISTHGDKG